MFDDTQSKLVAVNASVTTFLVTVEKKFHSFVIDRWNSIDIFRNVPKRTDSECDVDKAARKNRVSHEIIRFF